MNQLNNTNVRICQFCQNNDMQLYACYIPFLTDSKSSVAIDR